MITLNINIPKKIFTTNSFNVQKNNLLIRTFTVLSTQHLNITHGRSIMKTTALTVFSITKRFTSSKSTGHAARILKLCEKNQPTVFSPASLSQKTPLTTISQDNVHQPSQSQSQSSQQQTVKPKSPVFDNADVKAQSSLDTAKAHLQYAQQSSPVITQKTVDDLFSQSNMHKNPLIYSTEMKQVYELSPKISSIQHPPTISDDKQPLREQDVIAQALANKLIKYSTAGKEGDNGGLQLTKAGHELNRTVSKESYKIQPKTESPLNDDNNKAQFGYEDNEIPIITNADETPIYGVVTLEIHEDTLIPTPMQNHMVVVKNKPHEKETVEGFAYLTSTNGTKTGISGLTGPTNPKLADVKASGQQQDQYVAPIIPPINIPMDKCEYLDSLDSYINKLPIITVLNDVYEQTSKYQLVDYKTQGVSLEKLHELNELHAEIAKKDNNPFNAENIHESHYEFSE